MPIEPSKSSLSLNNLSVPPILKSSEVITASNASFNQEPLILKVELYFSGEFKCSDNNSLGFTTTSSANNLFSIFSVNLSFKPSYTNFFLFFLPNNREAAINIYFLFINYKF